jgi:hypothetical protein
MIGIGRTVTGNRTLKYSGPGGKCILAVARTFGISILELNRTVFAGTSIEFLSDSKLKGVFLTDWKIKDISVLYTLSSLQFLSLNTPKVKGFDVSVLEHLTDLDVDFPHTISMLEKCLKLERLFLGDYNALSVESLNALVQLKTLCLGNVHISDIKDIMLPSLETLELRGARSLNSLQGIENMKNLRSFTVIGARSLENISALENTKSLTRLCLIDCPKLESIKPLKGNPFLEEIILVGTTKINDFKISPLLSLQNLKKIEIAEDSKYDISLMDIKRQMDVL